MERELASSEGRSSEPPSVVSDEELLFREITKRSIISNCMFMAGNVFWHQIAKSAYVAIMIKWSREDSWVAYVLFLRNRKQFLRSVYVYVVFWTFYIFGRGKKCFRRNHLADPLQYLRGPPVEDLCIRVLSVFV